MQGGRGYQSSVNKSYLVSAMYITLRILGPNIMFACEWLH